jgi:hypothetical protein
MNSKDIFVTRNVGVADLFYLTVNIQNILDQENLPRVLFCLPIWSLGGKIQQVSACHIQHQFTTISTITSLICSCAKYLSICILQEVSIKKGMLLKMLFFWHPLLSHQTNEKAALVPLKVGNERL